MAFLHCCQAAEASGKVQELQAELANAYKRLSKTSEELLQVRFVLHSASHDVVTLVRRLFHSCEPRHRCSAKRRPSWDLLDIGQGCSA